jgi:thiol-disulfide isomerase/thioredoxin
MKTIKFPIILITASIVLEFLVYLLERYMNTGLNSICGFFALFILTTFFSKKLNPHFKPYQISLYILTGLVLSILFFKLIPIKPAVFLFSIFLVHLSGIIAGYIFNQRKSLPTSINLIASGLILETLVSPLRAFCGMEISSVIGFIAFLLTTWYLLKKYHSRFSQQQIIGYFLLGILLIQAPIRIFIFTSSLISLPDFLVHVLGIFAGYFFYERKKLVHKINLSVSVLVVLFVYFYGYSLWMNNLQYGNFNGHVFLKGPENVILKNKNNKTIKLEKGKLIVLDFWFVGCGSCIEEFPAFQKTYTKYKDNPKIQFYSVNQPFKSDTGVDRFKLIADLGYNFPIMACPDRSLTKELKIAVYPTIVVIDTGGNVIFKGGLENLESTLEHYL